MAEFWTGLLGTVVGSAITLFAQWLKYNWETREQRKRTMARKALLKSMLDAAGPHGWRKMETLSAVIGATREDTALLLVEIGARGSETGNDVWGWEKHHPLPTD